MDRLLTKKKVDTSAVPGNVRERERERKPPARNTLTRMDFGNPGARGETEHRRGRPIKGAGRGDGRGRNHRIGDNDVGCEDTLETRTETLKRKQDEKENPRTIFPEILDEDTLLSLSSSLTYRLNCIKQATRYANILGKAEVSCEDVDIAESLERKIYQPGARHLEKQIALERVKGLVENAHLFGTLEKGKLGREEKAVVYVAVALIRNTGWEEACKSRSIVIERRIMELMAKRHDVTEVNIFHPTSMKDYLGPTMKDEVLCLKRSQQSTAVRDSTVSTTPPVVVRGGFGAPVSVDKEMASLSDLN